MFFSKFQTPQWGKKLKKKSSPGKISGLKHSRSTSVLIGLESQKHKEPTWRVFLLMEEILHQLIGSLSHYLQGFIHPRWCRNSSINSSEWNFHLNFGGKLGADTLRRSSNKMKTVCNPYCFDLENGDPTVSTFRKKKRHLTFVSIGEFEDHNPENLEGGQESIWH